MGDDVISRLTVWKLGTSLFERVYIEHPGTESEAFAAAIEATEPLIPALREEMHHSLDRLSPDLET